MAAQPPRDKDKPVVTFDSLVAQFEQAQAQFRALREAVDQAALLADMKEEIDALIKERDAAFRSLGEAVWEESKAGRMVLPRSFGGKVRALDSVEKRRAARTSEISALLAEGQDVARRLAKPPPPPQSGLARGPKKR